MLSAPALSDPSEPPSVDGLEEGVRVARATGASSALVIWIIGAEDTPSPFDGLCRA